ncbi:hypothetical protein BaRGS_00017727 [Batillaria attramentaria]|uniref:Uncharacterized protein n=1 Tax=Batillaria attramentaria TaxID=370345 RepID=A0ABD0KVI8_9CAEN
MCPCLRGYLRKTTEPLVALIVCAVHRMFALWPLEDGESNLSVMGGPGRDNFPGLQKQWTGKQTTLVPASGPAYEVMGTDVSRVWPISGVGGR